MTKKLVLYVCRYNKRFSGILFRRPQRFLTSVSHSVPRRGLRGTFGCRQSPHILHTKDGIIKGTPPNPGVKETAQGCVKQHNNWAKILFCTFFCK